MATDDTITRYGSMGANQGFAIVVRPDGPWVRYEDHQRALTAALRERDEARAALAELRARVRNEMCGCPVADYEREIAPFLGTAPAE